MHLFDNRDVNILDCQLVQQYSHGKQAFKIQVCIQKVFHEQALSSDIVGFYNFNQLFQLYIFGFLIMQI